MDSLDATLAERLEIIIAVDEYVFGHCLHSRNNANGPNDHAAMHSYIKELLGSGEYPHLEALIAEQGFDAVWTTTQRCFNDEGRFDRNICRLLDGFYQR